MATAARSVSVFSSVCWVAAFCWGALGPEMAEAAASAEVWGEELEVALAEEPMEELVGEVQEEEPVVVPVAAQLVVQPA